MVDCKASFLRFIVITVRVAALFLLMISLQLRMARDCPTVRRVRSRLTEIREFQYGSMHTLATS